MYFAHSGNRRGSPKEPLEEHLRLVAARAAGYAKFFDAEKEAEAIGLLHDLGKYSDSFQRRLKGEESGLDHWTPGCKQMLLTHRMRGLAGALCIRGHHVGLEHAFLPSLNSELSLRMSGKDKSSILRVTESDLNLLEKRFVDDFGAFPTKLDTSVYDPKSPRLSGMLDIRMLFSALVDADFIETEAHFQGEADGTKRYRVEGPRLEAGRALEVLTRRLETLGTESTASDEILCVRADLLDACLTKAEAPTGTFTLAAPTGAGKTLAMLAFALRHAEVHPRIRRVIMVIPYLSIIEQTVRTYRELLDPNFGHGYVVEDHSMAETCRVRGTEGESADNEDEGVRTANLLSENWDAPLVVTTSVKCLESLFSNRPGACRKLHRMADSIILFDEVQTLPAELAVPTLAALSRLADRYGSTVVFSTATQPAFEHLNTKVCTHSVTGWNPTHIAPRSLGLFPRARRVRVHCPGTETKRSWEDIAGELASAENERVLCIVNLKKHAVKLVQLLREQDVHGLLHLSTSMCPAHRKVVLDEVRDCLNPSNRRPCRLISTQCVEAGVDIDFPVVYRAFGPLEAIAQAAGRCNRNGNNPKLGQVRVFHPESEDNKRSLYPPGGYKQAAETLETLLKLKELDEIDVGDLNLFTKYYKLLYDLTGCTELREDLKAALERRSFVDVAKYYRLIKQDTINVLVPYDPQIFEALKKELADKGKLTREWIRKARPHTVGLYRPKRDDQVWNFLNPAPLTWERQSDDWFVYLDPMGEKTHYDPLLGLNTPSGPETWMV